MSATSWLRPARFVAGLARELWRAGVISLLLAAGLGVGLWAYYEYSAAPVLLLLDGQPWAFRTHQARVGGLLQEVGLSTNAADVVLPPAEALLAGGDRVIVQRARAFTLEADGAHLSLHSHAATAADLLHEAGVRLGPNDTILIEGQPAQADAPFMASAPSSAGGPLPPRPAALHIAVRRAVPWYIHDGTLEGQLYTTAATVGQALLDQGIILYLGDQVNPSLGTRLTAGLHVFIRRSMPVEILVDGQRIRTRTQVRTVGDLLAQEGIGLYGQDRVQPVEETPIGSYMIASITRVREEMTIEEETLPFETVWEEDPLIELDQQETRTAGHEGLLRRRLRIRYENDQEVSRVIEDEWIERPPENKSIHYGAKIVLRTLETPDGPITYWRHFRALATAYTAATSGKSRDHPAYGITRSGLKMRHGIIAVDPTVIPLFTNMYVPGYGPGLAGDTGGLIIGRHIDLGFEEDDPAVWSWYRWVDVYLLAPAPPADRIRYVLPNWPREPK
jgi:uncharacterized protein YabE (DUF348 family)